MAHAATSLPDSIKLAFQIYPGAIRNTTVFGNWFVDAVILKNRTEKKTRNVGAFLIVAAMLWLKSCFRVSCLDFCGFSGLYYSENISPVLGSEGQGKKNKSTLHLKRG